MGILDDDVQRHEATIQKMTDDLENQDKRVKTLEEGVETLRQLKTSREGDLGAHMKRLEAKVDEEVNRLTTELNSVREGSEERMNELQDKVGGELLIINKNTVPGIK